MRRRITAAALAILIGLGFTAASAAVTAAPASASDIFCC
jgi:hypothetical protein